MEASNLEMVRTEETFILQIYPLVENELILVLHFDWLRVFSSEIIQNKMTGASKGETYSRSIPVLARLLNELRSLQAAAILGRGTASLLPRAPKITYFDFC